MGLSAGQARLLTITGRKSDCEFQSMRLSHQKIALTRQLADLSNEYQNSLDKTKLIYDFYGTGDTSTQLSYGILMSPSALNNYMPTLITDSLGRVTLNSKLAAAARLAGIPQEGLGTLPSDAMRNNFIQALGKEGVITTDMANKIAGLPYNQSIGFGGGTTVAATTQSGTLDELCKYLQSSGNSIDVSIDWSIRHSGSNYGIDYYYKDDSGKVTKSYESWDDRDRLKGKDETFNLGDILSGKVDFYLWDNHDDKHKYYGMGEEDGQYLQSFLAGMIDDFANSLSDVLGVDDYALKALDYAVAQTKNIYTPIDSSTGKYRVDVDNNEYFNRNNGASSKDADRCIGWSHDGHYSSGRRKSRNKVSINNMLKTFLTCYEDFINGVSKTDIYGQKYLDAKKGLLAENKLVTDKKDYLYTWKTGTEVSSDDMGQAAFYDALFNKICAEGWTENKQIEDNRYLQEMLQSGRLYVSRTKDDGYYYQGNYATDSYIKEIADESLIAKAEAKYNTEKAKLNQKEEMLDLKMKNLDTEISSLTTEYDTVKNTISKNIEKSFKRYNA